MQLITNRDQYNDNIKMMGRYRNYLKSREIDAKVKKNAWMIKERDTEDEDELIMEMARLTEENKYIREQAIINLSFLDHEYNTGTNIVSSQFNPTCKDEVHAT